MPNADTTPRTPGLEDMKIRSVEGGYVLRIGDGAIPEVLTADALLAELRDRLGAAPSGEPSRIYAEMPTAEDRARGEEYMRGFGAGFREAQECGALAGAAPAEREGREREAVEAYIDMLNSLYPGFDRQTLDAVNRAMQDRYGSPHSQVTQAVARALAAAPREQRAVESVESATMQIESAAALPVEQGEPSLSRAAENDNEADAPREQMPSSFTFDLYWSAEDGVYVAQTRSPARWGIAAHGDTPHEAVREYGEVLSLALDDPNLTPVPAAPTSEAARLAGELTKRIHERADSPTRCGCTDCELFRAAARLLRGER